MNDPMLNVTLVPPDPGASATSRSEGQAQATKPQPEARAAPDPAVRGLKERFSFGDRVAEFAYDEDLDRVVITIYSSDSEPREVVRQIPPEQFQTFAAKYRELLGVLFDQKA